MSFVVAPFSALAQSAPPLINYQGRVTDAQGRPFSGVTNLAFSVYAAPSNGLPVWGPQPFGSAVVVDGFFAVTLGSDALSRPVTSAFTNAATWVETVCGTRTNVPRQQILSVPYAAQAEKAGGLNGAANWSAQVISDFSKDFNASEEFTIPSATVTITSHGRPVMVALQKGTLQAESYSSKNAYQFELRLQRTRLDDGSGSTIIVAQAVMQALSGVSPINQSIPLSWSVTDFVESGTWQYQCLVKNTHSLSHRLQIYGAEIVALEL